MLKKLQCMEKTVKQIKTEPLDISCGSEVDDRNRRDHNNTSNRYHQIQFQQQKIPIHESQSQPSTSSAAAAAAAQKIILSPRVDYIQRNNSNSISTTSNQYDLHRSKSPLPHSIQSPPQIIITRAIPPSSTSSSSSHHQFSAPMHTQQVRVIRDGRLYEETLHKRPLSPMSSHHHIEPPQILNQIRTVRARMLDDHPQSHLQQYHQSNQQQKYVVTRHVNVISGNSNNNNNTHKHMDPIPLNSNISSNCSSSNHNNNVFRTPVVSSSSNPSSPSTSTAMRPPPPPPPLKIKNTSPPIMGGCSEEPSSSMPDLGEFIFYFFF